jgi:hypothetical protein
MDVGVEADEEGVEARADPAGLEVEIIPMRPI